MKKTILIGKKHNEIYTATLDTSNGYLSITGTAYDSHFFDEKEGEQMARECLEDGELWKMAVENNQTTKGLGEWIEEVLTIDGWMHVLGNVVFIDYDLYTQEVAGGCLHDIYKDLNGWDDLKLTKEEMKILDKAAETLHLKNLEDFSEQDKELYNKVVAIFNKYKEFEEEDLKQYA